VRPRKQTRDFEGFVAESGDALLRMATRLTSAVHRAEDVYQETLHRLAARQ
jgi:DNA-directed RNA polymerase specialized sigma24 family protein